MIVSLLWIGLLSASSGLPAVLDFPRGVASATSDTVWIFADFNGDREPDFVSFNAPGRNEPRMQLGPPGPGTFAASFGIPAERLRARDLDGDNDRDIVLETAYSVPLAVWINDGTGHFQRGNLEDFRFQLSHEDSRTIDRTQLIVTFEVTDDCPRGDAASPVSGCSPVFTNAEVTDASGHSAGNAIDFPVRPRGPPSTE